jgi:prepilin-type N-terminal cleavage/methylation domain-containing protein
MKQKRNNQGFTLLEATFAMVLLAIAAAGILLPFANAASVQAEASRQMMAAALASELLEKVQATDYALIVSMYDGYSEEDGALLNAAGQAHTGSAYAGFRRSAACQPAMAGSVELIAVTVTVFYGGAEMTRVTTLIGQG